MLGKVQIKNYSAPTLDIGKSWKRRCLVYGNQQIKEQFKKVTSRIVELST